MSIERIMMLMVPPKTPADVNGHDWPSISKRLGVKDLPTDYKIFVATYGTGSIGEFLWIMNPFSKNNNLNLEIVEYVRGTYEFHKKRFPQYFSNDASLFLPWGMTDNGDSLFWYHISRDPEHWLVGIQSSEQSEEEYTELRTSAFLEALLNKSLASSILPYEWIQLKKAFRPTNT